MNASFPPTEPIRFTIMDFSGGSVLDLRKRFGFRCEGKKPASFGVRRLVFLDLFEADLRA